MQFSDAGARADSPSAADRLGATLAQTTING
jgi:hypothetical protein